MEHLVSYLESLLEESKEERKGHGSPKMIARDYQILKEFVTKMTSHVDVQMREYYINKKARELLAEVDNLQVCRKALASFQYLRSVNLEMIGDQFQSVIDKTASKALPDNFTRDNIGDLYKLKVGKAKQLCSQFSKMRASQEMTEEQQQIPESDVEARLEAIETKFA